LVIAVAVFAALACRGGGQRPLTGESHAYRCADGFRIVVRFEPQRAWIFEGETLSSAPQVPTRTGARYATSTLVFTTDGYAATLQRDGTQHIGCVRERLEGNPVS